MVGFRSYINNQGFTLIELTVVVILLSILVAVAVPRFIDVNDEARLSAVQGVAEGLGSASVFNYAKRKANNTKGVSISNCTDIASALSTAALPAGFTITPLAIPVDTAVNCTVTDTQGNSATFVGWGIA